MAFIKKEKLMKKFVFYKLITGIVLVSAIILSGSFANAQRRSSKENKTRYEERNKTNVLRNYDRSDRYNKSTYRADRKHAKSKTYGPEKNISKHHKNYKAHRGNQHYANKHYRKHRSNHKHGYYSKHLNSHNRSPYFYNNYGHSCYHHTRYGDVVMRFASEPLVIRYRNGKYFYSEGYYYRFYPEIGFVVVNPPSSVYFSYIPDNCRRVSHHGNVYYSNGDLCFERHRKGFRLVKAPLGIHLSLKF